MPHCLSADETMARIHRDNLFLAWGLAAAWTDTEIERLFQLTTEQIRRDAGMIEEAQDGGRVARLCAPGGIGTEAA